jgi:hypothetical protein
VGLPDGWRASVSSLTGRIMFQNIETGLLQDHVPPGFADLPKESENENSMSASAEDNDSIPDLVSMSNNNKPFASPFSSNPFSSSSSSSWSSPNQTGQGNPPSTFDFTPRSNIFNSTSQFLASSSSSSSSSTQSPSTLFTFGTVAAMPPPPPLPALDNSLTARILTATGIRTLDEDGESPRTPADADDSLEEL